MHIDDVSLNPIRDQQNDFEPFEDWFGYANTGFNIKANNESL